MSDHPSAIDLDEWFVERTPGPVALHVAGCSDCTAYIAELETANAAFQRTEPAEAFLRRPAVAAELNRPDARVPTWWPKYGFGTIAGLAAAAVALLVMFDRGKPSQIGPSQAAPTPDIVRIKGRLSLSVVLKRGQEQKRYTGRVKVQPGDEIRVELLADKPTQLSVGIQTDAGDWLPLRESFTAAMGSGPVHDDAIVFDEEPTRGWVLAGPPDDIARIRSGQPLVGDSIARLRIEWEQE